MCTCFDADTRTTDTPRAPYTEQTPQTRRRPAQRFVQSMQAPLHDESARARARTADEWRSLHISALFLQAPCLRWGRKVWDHMRPPPAGGARLGTGTAASSRGRV